MKPTGRTLRHGHLLYPGVVPARCHLHLAVVGVDVPVRAAHGLPVVAAVPRAQGLSLSGASICLNSQQGQHTALGLAADAHTPSLRGMHLAHSIWT